MIKEVQIEGMTCNGCVAKVKDTLEHVKGVESVDINLETKSGLLQLERDLDLATLQEALGKAGNYHISEDTPTVSGAIMDALPEKSLSTYRPLILIVLFIAGVSFLAQFPFEGFSGMLWMRHFMAGFFIVFSFFKLLNLDGFSTSYRMYDLVAKNWNAWGYVYPFVELGLGILYLTNLVPFWTNLATVVVLGVSSIGVIQANLNKSRIKCACLGEVFNLPMSTVTIVEDVAMVLMAVAMLVLGV